MLLSSSLVQYRSTGGACYSRLIAAPQRCASRAHVSRCSDRGSRCCAYAPYERQPPTDAAVRTERQQNTSRRGRYAGWLRLRDDTFYRRSSPPRQVASAAAAATASTSSSPTTAAASVTSSGLHYATPVQSLRRADTRGGRRCCSLRVPETKEVEEAA